MTTECEFDLTLNLLCSVGVLAYDLDVRVTVGYEIDGDRVDWSLEEVRRNDWAAPMREGDPCWFLFKEAVREHEEIIVRECFDHDDMRSDGDYRRDIRLGNFVPAANLIGIR